MQSTMLVDDVQPVQHPKYLMLGPLIARLGFEWLKLSNGILNGWMNAADFEESALASRISLFIPLIKSGSAVKDGKLCRSKFATTLKNRQFSDYVIQSRTKVVKYLTNNNRPLFRN